MGTVRSAKSSRQNGLQSLYILQVLSPSGKSLEKNEVRDGGYTDLGPRDGHDFGTIPELLERQGILDEQVDLAHGLLRVVEGEHAHVFPFDPFAPGGRLGELFEHDGRARLETQRRQSRQDLPGFAFVQVDDEVDVGREPRVPVEHGRQPTHDDVARAGRVQGGKDRFEESHGRSLPPGARWTRYRKAVPVPRVEIEYCTQCRWLLRAAWMAQELLTTFTDVIGEVALVPGRGGVFEVRLDGEVLFSRAVEHRFPEAAELKQLVRDRISPERDLGHSDAAPRKLHSPEDLERLRWQLPEAVIARLGLREQSVVADVGAGTGYFAVPIARAVPAGRVFAIEVQREMLDRLRERLSETNAPENVELVLARAERTGLPAHGVDVLLLVHVWHELADPAATLAEAHRVLKADGRLAVVDFRVDVDRPPGPPIEDRVAPSTVERLLVENGFDVVDSATVGPYSYFIMGRCRA